jgi:hypothetical protein
MTGKLAVVRQKSDVRISFIGAAGIPNRYGGFEAFLEHCAPVIAESVLSVIVTCDRTLYNDDCDPHYQGVERLFIGIRANGASSILHDLVAFFRVFRRSTHIVILGVSGGLWFPLFRLMCDLGARRLIVNVDGVEWQRGKFSWFRKAALWLFDMCAQIFAHDVIIDNVHLQSFILGPFLRKTRCITYPGDHVLRLTSSIKPDKGTALTICRIEPENNIDMLIYGALLSSLKRYTVIGNWEHSDYGKSLRARHSANPRLALLNAEYDPGKLARHRESCEIYIHGHSVGGTNPSLVEMIFYDCDLLCYDVPYHHETTDNCARFFSSAAQLAELIDTPVTDVGSRKPLRQRYTRDAIAAGYLDTILGGTKGISRQC